MSICSELMCGQCCITRKGRSAEREMNPHRNRGKSRYSQIYFAPSPSLIDLDRPALNIISNLGKFLCPSAQGYTSIPSESNPYRSSIYKPDISPFPFRERRRERRGTIGGEDLWRESAWSPVFSRLLACGISRRPEQPGSATIIR